MRTLNFNDFEDFAMEVSDTYDRVCVKDDMSSVSIVALYDEAKEIIRELLCIGYSISSIYLKEPDCNGYKDEYIITIFAGCVGVEPAKYKGNKTYCDIESDVCYVLDNCSSKVIPSIDADEKYEVSIDIMDDCSDEFECDPYSCNHKATCGVFDRVEKDDVKSTKDEKILTYKPDVKISKNKDGDMNGISFSRTDNHGGYESWSVYSNREFPIEALSRLIHDYLSK